MEGGEGVMKEKEEGKDKERYQLRATRHAE